MIRPALALVALAAPLQAHAGVVINELAPNPDGTDTGFEWVEIYNDGGSAVDVSGWKIEVATSGFNSKFTFPANSSIPAGGYVVIGEASAAVKDYTATLEMGNASSSADAVRIKNSGGTVVDTVVYGTPNSDAFADDAGVTATSLAPTPGSGQVLARQPNGADTNASGADFRATATATPKAANGGAATCSTAGNVKINEFLTNAAGGDNGFEWIELYNPGGTPVDVGGWALQMGTTAFDQHVFVLPAGTTVASQDYLLIGEASVTGKDVDAGSGTGATALELGNATTSADGLRLVDCQDAVRDVVVYGTPNSDAFQDEKGLATSLAAGSAPDNTSHARKSDGDDTDQSGVDFALDGTPTPGAANDPSGGGDTGTPLECDPDGTVVINELMSDPAGSDDGLEWIELYNAGSATVDLTNWKVDVATQSFATKHTFASGTTLGSHQILVVGGSLVAEADVTAALSLGNAGSSADAVRLVACDGTPADTVVYGSPNSDALVDDHGAAATSLAPAPGSGQSLARQRDGVDTDASGSDFEIAAYPTPGDGNDTPPVDCGASATGVKINEFVPNPAGADADGGLEWLELYNAGDSAQSLSGWTIEGRTSSSWSKEAAIPSGTSVPVGGYLVIGGPNAPNVDVVINGFDIGSGTDGDGVRLVDCKGFPADTVAYGGTNIDGINDDAREPAISIAPAVDDDESLQRVVDGYDSGDCRADFVVQRNPTPGASNPEFEPIECLPSEGLVFINELLPDPSGADGGKEWVELYNTGGQAVSLGGWWLSSASQPDDEGEADVLLPGGTEIDAEGYLVIGGEDVAEADVVLDFSLGGGSDGDALILYDCEGNRVDTVVYGPSNEDGVTDDFGDAPGETYGDPGSDFSLARDDDGVDSNSPDDWFVDGSPSPGGTNYQEVPDDTGTTGPRRGCGCNRSSDPSGAPDPEVGRCRTAPGGEAFTVGLLALLLWRRRR